MGRWQRLQLKNAARRFFNFDIWQRKVFKIPRPAIKWLSPLKGGRRGPRRIPFSLGPGLVTGAADDDPSGIATYSQAGAQLGFALLWTMFFTTPFMIAIQLTSARIGRVTGLGIIANLKARWPPGLVLFLVLLLVAANTINIAADLAAMGEATTLVLGGWKQGFAVSFGLFSFSLEVFVPYRRYSPFLKWLTLVLFVYVACAFTIAVPWRTVLAATIWPHISLNRRFLLVLVAVFGTTISPYLFFWQADQEVEDMALRHHAPPLKARVKGGQLHLQRMAFDTSVGMIASNLVAFFIILTTAVTLHHHGITNITSSEQAALALRPIAGRLTFLLFAAGIIGTGLLAVPVLAGSAAYAVGESLRWRVSLSAKPHEAAPFYAVLTVATLLGATLCFAPVDPIKMLFWSAVLNGIVAVPVMVFMMLLATSPAVMGRLVLPRPVALFGWCATLLMLVAITALGLLEV
jgi:Mn2+/Fe2+ NRAMP family transporter